MKRAIAVASLIGALLAGTSPAIAREVARVHLDPAPPGAPLLILSIGEVRNPDNLPVNLQLFLAQADQPNAARPLGSVALYPNDQPGRFILRVSASDQAATRFPEVRSELVVNLVFLPERTGTAPELGNVRAYWVLEPR